MGKRKRGGLILLPHDLHMNILAGLPVNSLLRFRLVSKFWYDSINHPSFIKTHLHRAIQDNHCFKILLSDPSIKKFYSMEFDASAYGVVKKPIQVKDSLEFGYMTCSCNGLLLCQVYNDCGEITPLIWNPGTREFKVIPSSVTFTDSKYVAVHGLGYDPQIDDYKVVQIEYYYNNNQNDICHNEAKIYTLGTNTWRNIQNIPNPFPNCELPGLLVNETLHWVPRPLNGLHTGNGSILAFDLVDEKFTEMTLPQTLNTNNPWQVKLLGGHLTVICKSRLNKKIYEVWAMKEYGMNDSWSKVFTISQPPWNICYLETISFSKSGELLFACEYDRINDEYGGNYRYEYYLVKYDLNQGKTRICDFNYPQLIHLATYVESLVSLKSGVYLGQNLSTPGDSQEDIKRNSKFA